MSKKNTEGSDAGPKTCFIVTPIGQVGSDINKRAMGLIDAVISPVLSNFNFVAVAANHISSSGSINRQIFKQLTDAELVIANLTDLNPNVMYELAIRHAVRKPVVLMAEDGQKLPFDLYDQRTVFYTNDLHGVNDAKARLKEFIESALSDKIVENPLYDSIEANEILEKVSSDDTPIQLLFDKIDRLESNVLRGKSESSYLRDSAKFFNNVTSDVFGNRSNIIFESQAITPRSIYEAVRNAAYNNGYNGALSFKKITGGNLFDIMFQSPVGPEIFEECVKTIKSLGGSIVEATI